MMPRSVPIPLDAPVIKTTGSVTCAMVRSMEVQLSPETEARLARIAAERGSDAQAVAQEAIERYVEYDEWFVSEVEKGLAAAERGELIEQEEIGRRIEHRFPR